MPSDDVVIVISTIFHQVWIWIFLCVVYMEIKRIEIKIENLEYFFYNLEKA